MSFENSGFQGIFKDLGECPRLILDSPLRRVDSYFILYLNLYFYFVLGGAHCICMWPSVHDCTCICLWRILVLGSLFHVHVSCLRCCSLLSYYVHVIDTNTSACTIFNLRATFSLRAFYTHPPGCVQPPGFLYSASRLHYSWQSKYYHAYMHARVVLIL